MGNIFCHLPFDNLFVDPDGTIRTCCVGRFQLGNINQDNIENILKNEKLNQIKSDLLLNKWPSNCASCKFTEQLGFKSPRHANPDREKKIRSNPDEPFKLKSFEYRLDKTCNLSCIYCSSEYSSSWGKIENKLQPKLNNKKVKEFENFLMSNLSNLKILRLYGGEPLLLKKSLKFIESIKDDTMILISTNLSVPNLEKNKIFNLLKTKPNVHWYVSFENIGKKFEYVRNGADWDTFDKNFKFLNTFSNFTIHTSSAYHIFSALDIEEFYDYVAPYENLNVRWHGVYTPKQFHVHRMPLEFQKICVEKIKNVMNKHNLHNNEILTDLLNGFNNVKNSSPDTDSVKQFLLEIESKLNKNVSYKELWTDLNV